MDVKKTCVKDFGRISLVDALRGFALLGIVLIHNVEHFDTVAYPEAGSLFLKSIDNIIKEVIFFMISGKAYAIFALLFGFSFFMQFEKRRLKGEDFAGRFVWRMCLLFCFGIFHVIFYQGEILSIYAIVGLVLVPLRNFRNSSLVVLAVILMLQPWETGSLIYALLNPDYIQFPYPTKYFQMTQIAQTEYSFWELAKVNLTDGFTNAHIFAWKSGRYMQSTSLILIGFLLGRKAMFVQSPESNAFWKKAFLISAVLFISLYLLKMHLPELNIRKGLISHLQVIVNSLANGTFTGVLVAAFTLLWFHTPMKKVFSKLEPYGKMSLTNYIASSMIGSFVYYQYGLGMYNNLGVTYSVLVGIVIFSLQLGMSRWWLSTHKQGPLEGLWHKLTWIKLKKANG